MKKARLSLKLRLIILIVSAIIFQAYIPATTLAVPDTQSPTVPEKLTVTNKTFRSISLSWSASFDNTGVKGYQVYRDGRKIITISKTSYTNTDLVPGRDYTYTVKAYDAAGNVSGESAAVSVSTIADTQPPTVPPGLAVSSADYTSIALVWQTSTDNTSLKGYEIYCNYKKVSSTSNTYYICKKLTPGATYTFTVKSYDIAGNYSPQSNTVLFATKADTSAPSIPTGLKCTLLTETEASLTWTASSDNVTVKSYEVFCDGVKISTTSKTSFRSTNLIPGKSYTYSIKALDSTGNISSNSTPIKVTTLKDLQIPTAPSSLKIQSINKSSVSLTWNTSTDNTKVKGYKIYCNFVEIVDTTRTHSTVKCPSGLGIYVFWVKSYDLVGNLSDASNKVTVITS